MTNRGAIGVFDSGIGGLTVLKELLTRLPGESFVYFGDTARVPYGTKSPGTVLKFSRENVTFLLDQAVKFIVVACNTASAEAVPRLQREFRIPIVGVIEPGARAAFEQDLDLRGLRSTSGKRSIHHMRVHVVNRCGARLVEGRWHGARRCDACCGPEHHHPANAEKPQREERLP